MVKIQVEGLNEMNNIWKYQEKLSNEEKGEQEKKKKKLTQ